MSALGSQTRRGRPAIYDSPKAKASADVVRRRERRQREAHERRERLHQQFYTGKPSPVAAITTTKEVQIILENPGNTRCIQAKAPRLEQTAQDHIRDEYGLSDLSDEDCWGITTSPSIVRHAEVSTAPDLCEEQLSLVRLVLSGVNVFYTGGAGTGKSTVLRAIVQQLHARGSHVHVVTPTGISALNVGGSTYYTYAGWNPGVMKKPLEEVRTMAMSKERRARIQGTDVLIIDEISMLESNQFRRLDHACQAARRNQEAFGGIQVVVTGDFYQLPPVKAFQTCFECGVELKTMALCGGCKMDTDEEEWGSSSAPLCRRCNRCGVELEKRLYCPTCRASTSMDDQWAFRSDTWQACHFRCVSLSQVHRQSDPTFVDILHTLRVGRTLNEQQLALLEDPATELTGAVELSPIRKEVERKNQAGFQAIKGAVRSYRCQDYVHIQGHHPHLGFKAESDGAGGLIGCQDHRFPSVLEMKFGMPVILLANIDVRAGLVNGSQGTVVGFRPYLALMKGRAHRLSESGEFSRRQEHQIEQWTKVQPEDFLLPIVRFENGVQVPMYPVCQDTELGDPAPFSVIARTQIPLLPAWAITIHKSQGMTLERAIVNVDEMFEPRMAYVALSRVRSLGGLKTVSRVGLKVMQDRGVFGYSSAVVRRFMEGLFRSPAGDGEEQSPLGITSGGWVVA